MSLSTYAVDYREMYRVLINDVEVLGDIKISPKLKNKIDIQSGTGANKGSTTFQGRELVEFSMSITVPFHFEDELDQYTFEEQDLRALQALALMFPSKSAGTSVKIQHPILSALGVFEVACKEAGIEKSDGLTTYSFEMVEYCPKAKVKPQAPTSPDSFGDKVLKDDLANAISDVGDP